MSKLYASESHDEEQNRSRKQNYSAIPSIESADTYDSPYLNPRKEEQKVNNIVSFRNLSIVSIIAIIVVTCSASLKVNSGSKSTIAFDAVQTTTATNTKPNFIFVLADDIGWNSLGYQNYDISFATPYMTNLAKSGIILSNYYTQEICTPARASLMTGRYPVHVGMQYGIIQPAERFGLDLKETLLPEVLKSKGGYKNYILGKWNLGHYNPKYLPTARGFDYFLGFMDGHTYYWSKRDPQITEYYDFMYADTECYNLYNGTDMSTYSTFLYEDKAVNIIQKHNYEENPMFLYLASQAAHDPFSDYDSLFADGIPMDYVGETRYNLVMENVVGVKRQQYTMSLMLLDDTIGSMVEALTAVGQLDNTYIIVTSDNGGCFNAGGKNGPLRGSKGSLYEGGTKVDAFIYSPLLSEYAGTTYNGIMHVSDWFPTMVSLAGLETFSPSTPTQQVDGFDQSSAMKLGMKGADSNPRSYLLYGLYVNVSTESFDVYTNAPVGLRNRKYKLLHAYTGNTASKWYTTTDEVANDDDISGYSACSQASSMSGSFTKYLFDLVNDPYETTNLYYDSAYDSVKADLYAQIDFYVENSRFQDSPKAAISSAAYTAWVANENFIQPWDFTTGDTSSPKLCSKSHILSPMKLMKANQFIAPSKAPTSVITANPTMKTRPPTSIDGVSPVGTGTADKSRPLTLLTDADKPKLSQELPGKAA